MEDILKKWQIEPQEISQIISENPSLRGFLVGYISEYKVRKIFLSDKRISDLHKFDDHDRSRKSDIVFQYKNTGISVEVKSLQTASVKKNDEGLVGRFQCDASDRRVIILPNGKSVETTCLKVGEFDLLAVNLFAFEDRWNFVFALNQDLPRSNFRKCPENIRKYLIASLVQVTWPPKPPFVTDPFVLLDRIVKKKR